MLAKMAEIADVAKKLLELQGPMTTMKLQKLAFYAQAYSLARRHRALFGSRFEAWVNGPVAPDLFDMHRGKFMVWPDDLPHADSSRLTEGESRIVGTVARKLGHLTGEQLRELSHSEAPWLDARRGLSALEKGDREITVDAISGFYSRMPKGNPLFAR